MDKIGLIVDDFWVVEGWVRLDRVSEVGEVVLGVECVWLERLGWGRSGRGVVIRDGDGGFFVFVVI